jgi:ribose-phosphate pyrophosphokinase
MITFKAKEASGEIINSALSEFTFPAGEKHIKHGTDINGKLRKIQPVEIAIFQPTPTSIHDDLITIGMWAETVHSHGDEDHSPRTVLIMPYVPGARADRGIPFGLSIYAELINSFVIDQIIILDPHSQRTPELLRPYDNLTVVYPAEFFAQEYVKNVVGTYHGIIAPDKGAAERAQGVADALGIPLFTATKERDEESGQLSNFKIEGLDPDHFYLVVDDICDRGGTFKGLAAASGLDMGSLDHYVTPGVISKDAEDTLGEFYEKIYTTNSNNTVRELTPTSLKGLPGSDQYHGFRRFDIIRLLETKIKY